MNNINRTKSIINIHDNKGSGIVLSFIVLMVVFILGSSFLIYSSSSLITSKHSIVNSKALACAEAGADRAIDFLMSGGPNGEEINEWRTTHPSTSANIHTNDSWYSESLSTTESFKLCVRDGSGITAGKVVITSIGTSIIAGVSKSRTIAVVVNLNKENVSVWNNVIFGGVGQTGKSINGNVGINGSVHLLGDGEEYTDVDSDGHWDSGETYTDSNHNGQYDIGEPYTDTDNDGHRDAKEPFKDVNGNGTRDPALTVTDLAEEISGNASIGNNYSGVPAGLLSHMPTITKTSVNGEMVESLKSKLRVKNGKVSISGAAKVGSANVSGNIYKETLDGTYVSDGFGGNSGISGVHSDNGNSNGYDLGEGLVKFPNVSIDPYTDKFGNQYANYLAYLHANATVVSGTVNIMKGTTYSVTGPNGSLSITEEGIMTISGMVYVDGDINIGPKNTTITYKGNGSLVTPNSTFINCNLIPANKFAQDDTLGLICGDRIELATDAGASQLTMAIAMYAQHKIISSKQNNIAGTMVSSFFEIILRLNI